MEKVRAFVEEKGIPYRVLLGGGAVAGQYGLRGIPATFLIDREGRIAWTQMGYSEAGEKTLESKLKEILPAGAGR